LEANYSINKAQREHSIIQEWTSVTQADTTSHIHSLILQVEKQHLKQHKTLHALHLFLNFWLP